MLWRSRAAPPGLGAHQEEIPRRAALARTLEPQVRAGGGGIINAEGLQTVKPTAKLRRLLSRYVDFVDGNGWYPRMRYLDHVLLALMSKSLTTAQSVLCLIDNGFWDEAFASTRTLLDIFYSVRFIANKDSEKRARRFAEYYGKDREQWMKVISDYFPSLSYETSPDHARLMGFATKFASPYSWSGVKIRDLVSEADSLEKDKAGKPVDYLFSYRTIYRWTSHYVHPTIVALDDHIVGESGKFVVHARRKTAQRSRDLALFNCCLYVGMTFRDALRVMNDEFPEKLAEDTEKFLKELPMKPKPS